ncbi:tetratricopeptide repeat-containing sensor histidine kinase [Flavobacterium sp.]
MKIKYLFLLLTIFFFACSKNKKGNVSSKNNLDSISYYLKLYNNSNLKSVEKLKNLNQSFEYLKKGKNNIATRTFLSDITIEFYKNNELEKFNESSILLLKLSLSAKDTINLGMAFRTRANYYYKKQNLDSSFYYYLKAEKIYSKLKDRPNYANILMNKGITQYSKGDYLGAELSLNKAHSIFKETKIYNKIYGSLDQLGLVSTELNEYEKGIFYFNKALEAIEDLPSKDDQIYYKTVCQNNIGYLYLKSKEFEKGAFYFDEALKNKLIKIDDPLLYSNLIDNLAYCKLNYAKSSNLSKLFFEALEIRKELKNKTAIVGSYIHISEYYFKQNDTDQAIKYSLMALNEAKESKIPLNIILALKQSSIVDKTKAFQYTEEYINKNDSLQIAERKSKDRFNRIAFETDEIIQEKDSLENKNRNLLFVFFGTAGLFLFLYYIRAQRAKNRELIFKQAQQKANEDIFNLMMSQQAVIDESRTNEKQKLARELHDGVLGRMFGLRLSLDSVNRKNDEESLMKRNQIINELKTIEQDIREISHDLNREKQVLINNFVSIVDNLIEEQKEKYEAKVSFFLDNSIHWDKIASAVKINLYRILQESLQNINKYAKAKNINIGFVKNDHTIIFKISDDGIGYDVNKKSKGIGMQNMVTRTKECSGMIEILSDSGEGTTITITIPFSNDINNQNNLSN